MDETPKDHLIMALAAALSLAAKRIDYMATVLADNKMSDLYESWADEARAACQMKIDDKPDGDVGAPVDFS